LIERLVIRRLYGRIIDTLLATWGVAILLQQAIRLEFGLAFFDIHVDGLGPGLQNMAVPAFLTQPFDLAGMTIQPYRSFIIVLTLLLTGLTWFLMYRTSLGMQVRAIMRNPQMAAACGIDVRRVSMLTFAYGSGLAGVAGVLLAGFKTVQPDMGSNVVVDGFLVVVVGGVGSLFGTLAAAGLLGQINGVIAVLSNDILARAVVFGVVILLILWRPRGLFSMRSR
ncbi:MAG: urea ABC transporter permease subunit UrtB, partial [Pseudomonadota bacterium]